MYRAEGILLIVPSRRGGTLVLQKEKQQGKEAIGKDFFYCSLSNKVPNAQECDARGDAICYLAWPKIINK